MNDFIGYEGFFFDYFGEVFDSGFWEIGFEEVEVVLDDGGVGPLFDILRDLVGDGLEEDLGFAALV